MIQRANTSYSQLDDICRQVERQFRKILANIKNAAQLRYDLIRLRNILECVPMGTVDFDLVMSRINNAQRYLESEEQGAARYEVRQLVRSLRSRLNAAGYTVSEKIVFEPIEEEENEGSTTSQTAPAA